MRPLSNAVCARHCGQAGHIYCTCPVFLEAEHPHACFSKACSSAMHITEEGHPHTHTHTHTHTYTHKRMRILTGAHILIHTHTHTHSHARTHARVALTVLMGFANFSASLVLLPFLSYNTRVFQNRIDNCAVYIYAAYMRLHI